MSEIVLRSGGMGFRNASIFLMLVVLLAANSGCAGSRQGQTGGADCLVVPGATRAASVAADSELDRRIFNGLGQATLIWVDCNGRIQPGLATQWMREAAGRQWVFVLADNIDAFDMHDQWASLPARYPILDSVQAAGERELHLFFNRPTPTPPAFLASIAFSQPSSSHLRIIDSKDEDDRDVLDAGVDVLITRDPAAIAYARSRPDLSVAALPWDRLYVVAHPSGSSSAWPDALLASLAAESVRQDARPFRGESWWSACGGPLQESPAIGEVEISETDIAFAWRDPVARDLANRLVALSDIEPVDDDLPVWLKNRRLVAKPVEPALFFTRFHEGRDAAYLVALDSRPFEACVERNALLEQAPWLLAADSTLRLTPLIETRAYVIARKGVGVRVDAWGRPFFPTEHLNSF